MSLAFLLLRAGVIQKRFLRKWFSKYDTDKRIKIARVISNEICTKIENSHDKRALDYGGGTGPVGLKASDLFNHLWSSIHK